MPTFTLTPGKLLTTLRDEWGNSLAHRTHNFRGIGVRTCEQLMADVNASRDASQDHLLHALLQAGHEGDQLAERVALQCMLPKAVHFARSCTALRNLGTGSHTSADAVSTAIGAVWESISTFPLTRTEKIKANIGLDALAIINKTMGTGLGREHTAEDDFLEHMMHSTNPTTTFEPSWGDDAFHDLVTVLTWAIDTEALTPEEVRMLARFDLGDPQERDRLADELGSKRDSVTRRVYRIRVKLMNAVRAHILEHGSWD